MFQDTRRWLRNHGVPSKDIEVYVDNLRKLFHKPSESEYQVALGEMFKKWSVPFSEYYNENIHSQITFIARWALEEVGLYNPYSGITNNQAEGLNHVLKALNDWREMSIDCLMLSLYYLQRYYLSEISRGQNELGTYHVQARFKNSFASVPMLQQKFYPPEEIVTRIKGELDESHKKGIDHEEIDEACLSSFSKECRARKLIEDGKIVHNAQLKVFTVAGSTGNYVTTLYPKETCTCSAKKDCYHIIAAKLSIGMNMEAKKPVYVNLSQLRRNSHK